MSETENHEIRINVTARYAPDRSEPARRLWFFLYTIEIINLGEKTVTLLDRHWIITDANGEVEEVQGEGVVGRKPRLASLEGFEYTSGCPLRTPFGSMRGTYGMVDEDGERFRVEIPPFVLRDPRNMQ